MISRTWASVPVLAAAALAAACASNPQGAPVDERVTTSTASSDVPTASTEASSGAADASTSADDWEARTRPLGESGSTGSQRLSTSSQTAVAPRSGLAANAPEPTAAGNAGIETLWSDAAAPPGEPATEPVNPAVVSLLNTATAQSRAGDHARAAATLERAIAIEPGNAWLWHRLAETRLREGRLDQAASMAAKSNSLAADDRRVQSDNWRIIAEVHRRRGETAAAAAAEARARSLLN